MDSDQQNPTPTPKPLLAHETRAREHKLQNPPRPRPSDPKAGRAWGYPGFSPNPSPSPQYGVHIENSLKPPPQEVPRDPTPLSPMFFIIFDMVLAVIMIIVATLYILYVLPKLYQPSIALPFEILLMILILLNLADLIVSSVIIWAACVEEGGLVRLFLCFHTIIYLIILYEFLIKIILPLGSGSTGTQVGCFFLFFFTFLYRSIEVTIDYLWINYKPPEESSQVVPMPSPGAVGASV